MSPVPSRPGDYEQMIGIATTILILATLIFLSWRLAKSTISTRVFVAALLFKAFGALAMVYISTSLYPGDSLSFFRVTIEAIDEFGLSNVVFAFEDTGLYTAQPRSQVFVRLLAPVVALTGESYTLVSFFFSTLAFVCSVYFATTCIRVAATEKTSTLLATVFLPTVTFWSSGILKDTLALSALFLIASFLLTVSYQRKVDFWLGAGTIVSLTLLFFLKHYLFIGVLVFAGSGIFIVAIDRLKRPFKWLIPVLTLVIFYWSARSAHSYMRLSRLPLTLFENSQLILEKNSENAGTGVFMDEPSWSQVIVNSPHALFLGLYRPTFFDQTPAMGILHKMENLAFLTLTLLSVILYIRYGYYINWGIVLPALIAIGVLAIFISLSTPNFGSLVRYRNAYLPFFVLLITQFPFRYWLSNNE